MPLRLSEHPAHDRPRERLWAVGPAALTGQELLAILLGTGCAGRDALVVAGEVLADRKSTRLNSSHSQISYAVFCLKKKNTHPTHRRRVRAPPSKYANRRCRT